MNQCDPGCHSCHPAMAASQLLVLTATLAAMSSVLAVPQQLREPLGIYSGDVARYEFGYEVNAPDYGNDFAHAERREGDDTSGQYRVLLPDGRIQVVSYTVNGDSGYVAEVSYQ
ncbi:pro-resilin-like [Portunus trituberculatus]|uniref:pro-resilin-like n=1 Tax=Portunus trituberculatus TaxID=210409 RepID=UPI001E1CE10B|nr:pro-resilin-like [Portunus trituberculatus]